ncbi:MAG: winged helix DNA-binding protein [Thaumarchaeota archaeon]|nr:winged helix DNA-binding protein [Nitrososphaerota archaeon]
MSKQKYRSEIGIVLDILNLLESGGQDGVIISAISRTANESYNSVNQRCQKLVKGGLITHERNSKNCRYAITEKGIKFAAVLRQFADTVKLLDIRY